MDKLFINKIAGSAFIAFIFWANIGFAKPTDNTILNSSARNYYVDAAAGNDENIGTVLSPWQNLTKLYSLTIAPGSKILLKAGSKWIGQQLKFQGSGVRSNPIVIDKYGKGPKPVIDGNGMAGEGIVYLYNQSFIEINNLEITNSPTGPNDADFFVGQYLKGTNPMGADRRGVLVAIDDYGTADHIYLKNLFVHHIKGQLGSENAPVNGTLPKRTGGIYFTVLNAKETVASKSRFNDVLIDSCTISYCENIGIALNNEWKTFYPGGQNSNLPGDVTEYDNWFERRFSNIRISNNIIDHIGKNAMIIRCTDETGLIEHNVCYETALGTTGNTMFTTKAKGTVFQFNEGYYNRATTQKVDPGNFDGSMYDPDFGSVGIIFQYSYSHDNSEGLYWGCNTRSTANITSGIPDPGDKDCILRYNISQNDLGNVITFAYPSAGNEIYNNVFYIKEGAARNIIFEKYSRNYTYNFLNNIIYNNSSIKAYTFNSGSGTRTRKFSHNLFFGIHPETEPADSFKITSDPMFVGPGTGLTGIQTVGGYQLLKKSPAIASGVTIHENGGRDYFGNIVSAARPNQGIFEGKGVPGKIKQL